MLITCGFALFSAVMAFASTQRAYLLATVVVLVVSFVAMRRSAQAQTRGDPVVSFGWSYASYVAAVCITGIATFPAIDRWHDLATLAKEIHADSEHKDLALLDPDETTIAMLDYRLRTPFAILSLDPEVPGSERKSPESVVTHWLTTHGSAARVLVLLPGHAPGELTRFLERIHPIKVPDDGIAATLKSRGLASILRRYDVPQGRRYALLGPP
jgi:hypothetical protein